MQNPNFISHAKEVLSKLGKPFNCYHTAQLTGNPDYELHSQLYYAPLDKYMEFTYTPEKAPCRIVLKSGECAYGEKIQELFPNDKGLAEVQAQAYIGYKTANGLIAVLSPEIIENPDSILNLLKNCSS